MKTNKKNQLFSRSSLLGKAHQYTAAASLLSMSLAHGAGTVSWIGGTSITWTEGANWSPTTVPVNDTMTDSALFNSTGYAFQPTAGTRSIKGLIIGDGTTNTAPLILSTTPGNNRLSVGASGIVMNAASGTVNIGTSNTTGIKLAADQTWSNASSSLLTVTSLTNAADVTPFTLTLSGAGSGGIALTGPASNGGTTGTTALSVEMIGSGVVTLSGASTYTGGTSVKQGTLAIIGLDDRLLTSGSMVLGAATTTGKLVLGSLAGSTSQTLAGLITTGLGGSVVGAHAVSNSTLTLNIAGTSTFGGTFGGPGTNENRLILAKSGTGTLTLSSAGSTNTGGTNIESGTLKLGAINVLTNPSVVNIRKIAGAGSSSGVLDLGGFSQTISALNLGNGITDASNAGQTPSVIDSVGGGVLSVGASVTYNAGSVGFLNGQATISANLNTTILNRIFVVGVGAANTTADLVISGELQSGGGIVVTGGGKLMLTNSANAHSNSNVWGGFLKLGADSVLGTGAVSFTTSGGGNGVIDLNGKTDAVGTTLALSNSGANTVAGSANQIIDSLGGGLLKLGSTVTVTYNAGTAPFNNGTTTISAALDLNGATRIFAINDSDQATQEVIISGAIQGTGAGLTKTLTGTLVLSGTNTYTGDTIVSTGTLSLGNGITHTSLADTAGVIIGTDATAILNLNYTGTDNVASLTIAGVAKAPGVYSSSDPSGRITGTGTLTVGAAISPYTTWANTFLPGNNVSNPAGDNDNDGLVNQQEFAYGLSPISGASVNPILVPLDKTTGTFTYQRRTAAGLTYRVWTSTNLSVWTLDAGVGIPTVTPAGANETVNFTLTGTKPLTAPKLFVRVAAD